VYKGFLGDLHFYGILQIADVDKIFANLSELCEVSSTAYFHVHINYMYFIKLILILCLY